MLGICAATKWEIRPVLRMLREVRRHDTDGVRSWHGSSAAGSVLVFRTGIGPAAAARAADAIVARHRLSALLNTGVAGGLIDSVAVGHLVIPDVILTAPPELHRFLTDSPWTLRLRALADGAGLVINPGPLLTSTTVLATANDKRHAAELSGASAVEMEGSALAAICRDHRIPFASVRAILDDSATHLPQFTRVGASSHQNDPPARENHSRPRAAQKISSFLALASGLRESSRVLTQFFRALGAGEAAERV